MTNTDKWHTTELQKIYVKINNKNTYNILSLHLQLGVNALPYCTIAVSAGKCIDQDKEVEDIQVDDSCAIYMKATHLKEDYMLLSGFIASRTFDFNSVTSEVQGYYSYRVAISAESIDAIAPASVRYLTGATGKEHALIDGFILTEDGAIAGKGKAYGNLIENQANNDVCGALLTAVDYLYESIKQFTKGGVNAKSKEPPKEIRKHFMWDKIRLNSKTDISMATRLADMVSGAILGGSAYLTLILDICRSLYLSYLPVYDSKSKTYKLKIEHINNWDEPYKKIDLSAYCSMSSSDVSRRADSIDGIVIPRWSDADNKATTAMWTFYGQLKDDQKARIHNITPDNMKALTTRNLLRCKQMSFPSWLSDGLTNNVSECCTRLCKEFFAEYACGSRVVSLSVPFIYYKQLEEYLGFPLSVVLLDGRVGDVTGKAKTQTLIGVLSGITLQIQTIQSQLHIALTATFNHVRTPNEQKIYGFNNTDLLYVDSK